MVTLALVVLLIFSSVTYAAASNTQVPNTVVALRMDSSVYIDGNNFRFHTFNVNGQSHIRIRDLAKILSGTSMQFDLTWSAANRAVVIIEAARYTSFGSELAQSQFRGFTGTHTNVRAIFRGNDITFSAISIGGENFIRLRELSRVFNFNVSWSVINSSVVLSLDGDTAEFTTIVSEGPGSNLRILDNSRPVVALTFDDGPARTTSAVLDTFDTYGAVATFFVLGSRITGRYATMQRIRNDGHEIGNHSWSHRSLPSLSQAEIRNEFLRTNTAIMEAVGFEPTLFRPPFGALDSRVIATARDLGMPIIRWSVDPMDWERRNADAVYNAVMSRVQDRDIVLLHDIHQSTADAVERLVPSLINQGYQLVTVSQLMCHAGINLRPGVEYRRGR
jgi:peptidoglycan/xylan/chitin deacetylase (PgdA/CDA1 family)